MGMIVGNEEEKSQLATEICELTACANLHHTQTNRMQFINWYRVLSVNENADINSIRKQYHKLSLQLHPDKNKYSKAETAFKLVSEAYFCLSDNARRAAFDLERQSISCIKCNGIAYMNRDPLNYQYVKIHRPNQETTRLNQIHRLVKELRGKLREEAMVIEQCLRANATASRRKSVNANSTRTEMPVFNPSDYQYKGYPHLRTINQKKLQDLKAGFMMHRSMHNPAKNGSPVFDCQAGGVSFHA